MNSQNVRPIAAAPKYTISESGEIRNRKSGRILKQWLNEFGYPRVRLMTASGQKNFRVNRLMAIAFIPNPEGLPEVNHIDGVKTNNRIDNLEWCSCRDNMRHAYSNGVIVRKLAPDNVRNIRYLIQSGMKQNRIASLYDVSIATVSDIKLGKTWSYLQ